ncbi:MAG: hypothetical protein U9Q74_17425 [Gemmatimonadota bacterium]|nr:hypothetical protein [Gemmatimonadota bacterium]
MAARRRGVARLAVVVSLAAVTAQAGGQRPPGAQACRPIAASRDPVVRFGLEGGSLRPRMVAIYPSGLVRAGIAEPSDSVGSIDATVVAALATFARSSGFWALRPPVIRRPPANPDAARRFIAVTLTCGAHRVEYVSGTPAAAVFDEFDALLRSVTTPRP